MNRSISLFIAFTFALFVPRASHALSNCLLYADDVFNQLQRNAWYLPTSDGQAQLYVTYLGRGSPVVFLHGGPGNDFQYIIDALRPHLEAHRFVLYEQRGSLLSPVPEKDISKLSIQQQVADLETLRKALGLKKLVLFGHSFGTFLALMYYEAHPDHVQGMILAGSVPPGFGRPRLAGWVKSMRPRQKALLGRMDAIAKAEKGAGLPADSRADTAEQSSIRWHIAKQAALDIVDLSRWQQVTGGQVYYNPKVDDAIGNTLPNEFDIMSTLKSHPVPITVISGDQDYIDPSGETWKSLTADNPVVIHVMPHAGHYSWIDDPKAFSAAFENGLVRSEKGP